LTIFFESISKRRVDILGDSPILRVRPSGTAGENRVLVWLLHYVMGGIAMLANGLGSELATYTSLG